MVVLKIVISLRHQTNQKIDIMTDLNSLTAQMQTLETIISKQQLYILKHGDLNDSGEYDAQWEEYKEDAAYNLQKWDFLKSQRDLKK